MKTGSETIKLKPGEKWTAPQECMTVARGTYLADWHPCEKGEVIENTSLMHEVTLVVDYGYEEKLT